ncbi:hypothetical protein, partial [Escherichia coli]|uniref:hypothetical protein n=1 Tax=Escherichia coli TaxID=562 RepID=UPI001F49A6E2
MEMVFVWKQNYILVDEYFFFCCTWIVNSALKKPENRAFFLISACPVNCHAVAAIPDVLLWPGS